MAEKEDELKMMLTKDEHHFVLRFLDKLMVESERFFQRLNSC